MQLEFRSIIFTRKYKPCGKKFVLGESASAYANHQELRWRPRPKNACGRRHRLISGTDRQFTLQTMQILSAILNQYWELTGIINYDHMLLISVMHMMCLPAVFLGLINEEEQKMLKAISLPNRKFDIHSDTFHNTTLKQLYSIPKSSYTQKNSVWFFFSGFFVTISNDCVTMVLFV